MYTLSETVDIILGLLIESSDAYNESLRRVLRNTVNVFLKMRLYERYLNKAKHNITVSEEKNIEKFKTDILNTLKISSDVAANLEKLIEISKGKDIVLDEKQKDRLTLLYYIVSYSLSICKLILSPLTPNKLKSEQLKAIAEHIYVDFEQIIKNVDSNKKLKKYIEPNINNVDTVVTQSIKQAQQKLLSYGGISQ